jgi:hypothetical protein
MGLALGWGTPELSLFYELSWIVSHHCYPYVESLAKVSAVDAGELGADAPLG